MIDGVVMIDSLFGEEDEGFEKCLILFSQTYLSKPLEWDDSRKAVIDYLIKWGSRDGLGLSRGML